MSIRLFRSPSSAKGEWYTPYTLHHRPPSEPTYCLRLRRTFPHRNAYCVAPHRDKRSIGAVDSPSLLHNRHQPTQHREAPTLESTHTSLRRPHCGVQLTTPNDRDHDIIRSPQDSKNEYRGFHAGHPIAGPHLHYPSDLPSGASSVEAAYHERISRAKPIRGDF
jgi:hypothetical protein